MKIYRGVSEVLRVENRPIPLTRPMAYTTVCITVQAVITKKATGILELQGGWKSPSLVDLANYFTTACTIVRAMLSM